MAGKRRIHPIGQRFNRLIVLAEAQADPQGNRIVLARCDCGVEREMRLSHLTSGAAKTCGCRRTTLPPPEFCPIPGVPRYFASRDGRVWGPKGLRKFGTGGDGYLAFSVVMDSRHTTERVSDCILRTFKGPREPGMVARHLDGDIKNNASDNLAWGTYVDNEADKRRHGRIMSGERNHQAKLTAEQVVEIRQRAALGNYTALGSEFGVTGTMVGFIVRRQKWAHVP